MTALLFFCFSSNGNFELIFSDSGTAHKYEALITYNLTSQLMYQHDNHEGVANYGLMIKSRTPSIYKHICSSEYAQTAHRPKVVVSYCDPLDLSETYSSQDYFSSIHNLRWYKFTPDKTDTYDIFTEGSADTYGLLYSSTLSPLARDNDSAQGYNFKMTYQLNAGVTYYIKVHRFSPQNYANGDYTIKVEAPFVPVFSPLTQRGVVSYSDIEYTDDKFYILTKPLDEILGAANITSWVGNDNNERYTKFYYDDWFIYAIGDKSNYVYGLCKMREQEYPQDEPDDYKDGDDPGVTISFIQFDISKLYNCLDNSINSNRVALYNEIDRVTRLKGQKHNDSMQKYFSNTASDAPYLIAELYIKRAASFAKNGYIEAPNNYTDILQAIDEITENINNGGLSNEAYLILYKKRELLQRVPKAISQNNLKAGYSVYNTANNRIYISDPSNLTLYEKYAILMTHTANVTFNSFAAEVEYHADKLIDILYIAFYERAIRADMAIGEDNESGVSEIYYDLNNEIVQQQIQHHGEY